MSALDELLGSWRANPDADATIALCTALGRAQRPDLMSEVRGVVAQWHPNDVRVMLGVGVMFLEAGDLVEAQAAFVAAGKADGRHPAVFRYLGEVLLRRGDAVRSEKVIERALKLEPTNASLRTWQERARMFLPLQSRLGMEAVAKEVARTVPLLLDPLPETSAPASVRMALARQDQPTAPQSKPPGTTDAPVALTTSGPSHVATKPIDVAMNPDDITIKVAVASSPSPEEVLAELAQVGVFERQEGGTPQWERPPRVRNRSLWWLVGGATLAAAAAVGGTAYARKVAQQRLAEAQVLCEEVATALRSGDAQSIATSDDLLSKVFELDPNGARASRLWLENRVLHWLVRGSSDGLESAIQRMRKLGAAEEQVVFGTVAVRLAEGDTQGALALLPTADAKAKGDAMYQMLAGIALERVGNVSSLERYAAALELDPRLQVARVLHARAMLSMQGADNAAKALEGIPAGSVERDALDLLGAALAPLQPSDAEAASPSSTGAEIDASKLPVFLRWIPNLWRARQTLATQGPAEARTSIEGLLELVDTPDAAVRVGELALAADSPGLVRQAALRAISLSPVHPPARLLAARAAVDMGRFDEALEALEGLEPKQGQAIALRAVIAYERGDVVALGDAVDALGSNPEPSLAPVTVLPALLVGKRVANDRMSSHFEQPEVMWGRLALADGAILQGDLEKAKASLASMPASTGPVARRLAGLGRWARNEQEALQSSARAWEASQTALTLIERVRSLLLAQQSDAARQLVESHGTLLGPMAPWLVVLIDVEQGRGPRAKARVATLQEPLSESPLPLRIVAAQALVAIGDRARGRPLVDELRRLAPRHPEIAALPARF